MFILVMAAKCAFACATPDEATYQDGRTLEFAQIHQEVMQGTLSANNVPFGFLVSGHTTQRGAGLVFQLKKDRHSAKSADANYTEELTIYVPELKSRRIDFTEVPVGSIVFYSAYSKGFLGNSGCFGYMKAGSLSVDMQGSERVKVTINTAFPTFDTSGFEGVCPEVKVSGSFEVTRQP